MENKTLEQLAEEHGYSYSDGPEAIRGGRTIWNVWLRGGEGAKNTTKSFYGDTYQEARDKALAFLQPKPKRYTPTYWNNKGKYQKEYEVLKDYLVPVSCKANTPQGEILRQASNYYYDCFNNGGGNDRKCPALEGAIRVPSNKWRTKDEYTDKLFKRMDDFIDKVIELIRDMNKGVEKQPGEEY